MPDRDRVCRRKRRLWAGLRGGFVRRGRRGRGRGHHGIAVDAVTDIGGSCGCTWSIRLGTLGTTIRGVGTECTTAEADDADECGEQNHVQRSK